VLDFAARLGLLGLTAFVVMQIAFWRVAWRVLREAKSSLIIDHTCPGGQCQGCSLIIDHTCPGGQCQGCSLIIDHCSLIIDHCSLIIGLMASMIDFLAHGLVDAAYFVVDLSFVFMLTLALMQEFDRS
jgi:O-antigen ligase